MPNADIYMPGMAQTRVAQFGKESSKDAETRHADRTRNILFAMRRRRRGS